VLSISPRLVRGLWSCCYNRKSLPPGAKLVMATADVEWGNGARLIVLAVVPALAPLSDGLSFYIIFTRREQKAGRDTTLFPDQQSCGTNRSVSATRRSDEMTLTMPSICLAHWGRKGTGRTDLDMWAASLLRARTEEEDLSISFCNRIVTGSIYTILCPGTQLFASNPIRRLIEWDVREGNLLNKRLDNQLQVKTQTHDFGIYATNDKTQ
jgi:hypothetical protein